MIEENQIDSTPTDDINTDGPSEQELLDAVLANSPIMEEVGAVPLPEEEVEVPDPVSEDEEVEADPESEEVVSEEDEEEVEEEVDEDAAEEEAATQEDTVFTTDDLDLDAKVQVKIDGEEMEVSFGDLIKGYQTDAHLSKKGRELGEAQKSLEEERSAKLQEVDALAEASAAMLTQVENVYAKQYKDLEEQIAKARADGDTYELNELKDKKEVAQQNYWNSRRRREGLMEQVAQQREQVQAQAWEEDIKYFQEKIPEYIPDFDEKVAKEIRAFALEEGLTEAMVDNIVDPVAIKMLNEYRKLKQGVTKGAAKRKVVPAKKAIPTKKAKPAAKKKADAEAMRKARAFREDASPEDHMDFLRDYASKTLSNI